MFARAALFLLVLAGAPAHAQLPQAVAARLAAAGIPDEAVGVMVQRLEDGGIVLSHGAERSLAPGSTMKVVTSWIALDRLGPAYRGRAELRSSARIADGVLHGDVVLRGLGDVDLDWRAFERMLQVMRHGGVREIRGDLILDRSFFRPARTDIGVAPFDEGPEFRYNVIPDALLVNTNLLQLDLVSDGRRVQPAIATPIDRVSVESAMTLVDRACVDWEDGWKIPAVVASKTGDLRIVLLGEFPRQCTASTSINVIDRVTFSERLFRALWKRLGGVHRGRVRDGEMLEEGALLAEHWSRPLADVVRDVNKRSDNPITRTLFLALGALSMSDPALPTAQRAEAEIRAWFERNGIPQEGLVIENGSGLSRTERIRPSQLAAVLRASGRAQWSPEFVASLPIAGVDGSMRRRLSYPPALGRARVKTGTLRDTSGVAGYVSGSGGGTYVVAAIVNHPMATRTVTRPILDELLDWVARLP